MAGSVNKVIIIGNLGRDPEVRSKVVNRRIATSESWKDRNSGERKERTEWHSVAIFNEHIAKVAEQYLRKGSTVYVEGQLETRKWHDQTGADRYTTEIVLRPFSGELTLLGGSPGNNDDAEREEYDRNRPRPAADNRAPAGGYGGGDLDDEIPFAPEVR